MIEKIIITLLIIPAFIGSLLFPTIQIQDSRQPLGADNFQPVQAQKFTLSGSGVTASASSITLQTFKTPDARKITLAMLGTKGFGTLEPGTSREEQISFTGVTQNADDTATLTGASRGLDFVAPYAASTTLQKAHAGGTIFILTNTASFYDQFSRRDNDEDIYGTWSFPSSTPARATGTVVYGSGSEEYFATKRYADSVASSGAADASYTVKGLIEIATSTEAASGTVTGGTSAFLALPALLAGSTSSARQMIPVTDGSGKLQPGFIDTTGNYTWSGSSTFSGAGAAVSSSVPSWFNASTTFTSGTTFTVLPLLASSTPTLPNEAARKLYVDDKIPIIISTEWARFAGGVDEHSTGTLSTTAYATTTVSSTFTLAQARQIRVDYVGYGEAGDGVVISLKLGIDGALTSATTTRCNSSAAAGACNLSFSLLTTSTLAVGTHNVAVYANSSAGGATVKSRFFAIMGF